MKSEWMPLKQQNKGVLENKKELLETKMIRAEILKKSVWKVKLRNSCIK